VTVESKPLLARLMSHPAAHTLEHIEKQQRSITPQPSTQQSQPTAIPGSANRSKRRNKTISQQESLMSTSAPISQDLPLPVTQNDSDGSTGFLRIQSPTNTTPTTLRNHQASNITNTNNAIPLASLFAQASGNAVRKIENSFNLSQFLALAFNWPCLFKLDIQYPKRTKARTTISRISSFEILQSI
jgi:mRNA-decapping enzyme 1B